LPAQADAVLERMRTQDVNPDELVFNSLIHVRHALKGKYEYRSGRLASSNA
jgi:hypothetical protein